MALQLKAK
jgi:hypothetical protein